MLAASGPLSTIAMPEICPRSLILLAMVAKRLAPAGNSVMRSGEAVIRHPSLSNRTSRFPASRCRRINRQLVMPVYPRAGLRVPQEAVMHVALRQYTVR